MAINLGSIYRYNTRTTSFMLSVQWSFLILACDPWCFVTIVVVFMHRPKKTGFPWSYELILNRFRDSVLAFIMAGACQNYAFTPAGGDYQLGLYYDSAGSDSANGDQSPRPASARSRSKYLTVILQVLIYASLQYVLCCSRSV